MSRARRVARAVTVLSLCATLQACKSNGVKGGLNFERMVTQAKGDAYESTTLFPDSTLMRMPPEGTIPRRRHDTDPTEDSGRRDGEWVERVPMGYSRALLARGKDRFGVYCSPCHGFDGFASTPIAAAMELRRPPALITPSIEALSDGRIYGVITSGYGLMPSYRDPLPEHDRWAVVAYLRALQLRQHVVLDSLPSTERARVLRALVGRGG